ncbi:MAG: hypothetical protein JOY51_08375, partial [Nevskia sp.]|nr:hypothetical protein [Nevskia sp.]
MTTPRLISAEPRLRGAVTAALVLAGLLGLNLALWLVHPQLLGSQHLAGGGSGPVELPWQFREVSRGDMLELRLALHWYTPRVWTVVPDDRLTGLRVNGQEVPLSGVPEQSLENWRDGFAVDLSPWLHGGDNTLQFTVDNDYGPGGI